MGAYHDRGRLMIRLHQSEGHKAMSALKSARNMASQGTLVVAIHDVAPPWLREVRYLLDALDERGVRPRVLKVIPNLDGKHDCRADPAFARMLAEEAAAGSEIVLHGYTHRRAGPLRGPLPTRLRARLFAGNAAEFLTLDEAAMSARLPAGRALLAEMGLEVRGFCPPCWLAPPSLPRLLREYGFLYTISMSSVLNVRTGARLRTPWFGYIGAGEAQERLVGLAGEASLLCAARFPIFKVFLHPQGAMTSAACKHVLARLASLVQTRRLETYGGLVAATS